MISKSLSYDYHDSNDLKIVIPWFQWSKNCHIMIPVISKSLSYDSNDFKVMILRFQWFQSHDITISMISLNTGGLPAEALQSTIQYYWHNRGKKWTIYHPEKLRANATLLTGVSEVEQHGHKHVIYQVKADTVCKDGVPQDQDVLHGKLPAK